MPDMYDKLGEMLNEALESGKIPNPQTNNDQDQASEKESNSGHFDFKKPENSEKKAEKPLKSEKKEQIPTGEVIKLHKYTYNMQYPPRIQKAITTLDIVYPFTQKDISKQYHKLLKKYHPDTQSTIQTSQSVQNIRQKTIDEITEAYKILCEFFSIK